MHLKGPIQNSEFPELVRKNFNFLIDEFSFDITSEQYTGFPYAEWIIILSSNDLFIQILLDKAQVNVGLGVINMKGEPIDLMFALMYMYGNNEWKYLQPGGNINAEYYDKQLKHASKTLYENFDDIKHFITEISNSEKEKKRYNKFVKEYFQKILRF